MYLGLVVMWGESYLAAAGEGVLLGAGMGAGEGERLRPGVVAGEAGRLPAGEVNLFSFCHRERQEEKESRCEQSEMTNS